MNKKPGTDKHPPLLMQLLASTGHGLTARLDDALEAHCLSVAKLSVLRLLIITDEPLPLGVLAQKLQCGKSNITQLVDRLQKDGLVHRLPDLGDRRCLRAAITEQGRHRYHLGVQAEKQMERRLLQNLTTGEQEQLAALLRKVEL